MNMIRREAVTTTGICYAQRQIAHITSIFLNFLFVITISFTIIIFSYRLFIILQKLAFFNFKFIRNTMIEGNIDPQAEQQIVSYLPTDSVSLERSKQKKWPAL